MDSKNDNITLARVIGLWEEDLRNLRRMQHAWNHIRNFCIVLEVCEVIRFLCHARVILDLLDHKDQRVTEERRWVCRNSLSMGHFRIASSLHFKTRFHRSFFSYHVTIAFFGLQNNGTADRCAKIELSCHLKTFFCSEQFAYPLIMRVKTIYITNWSRL